MEFAHKRLVPEQSVQVDQTGKSEESPFFIKTSNSLATPIATDTSIRLDRFDRILRWVSVLTLVLLFVTAAFTYLTLEQTRKQTTSAQDSARATQDAAVGTISSAATANESLQIQHAEFATDHRPYLVADTPSFIVNGIDYSPASVLKTGGYIEAQYSVNNVGRTPAKSYFVASHLYLYTTPPLRGTGEVAERAAVKDITRFLDGKFAELDQVLIKARKQSTVWITGGDLAPSVSVVYTSQTEPNFTPIRIATEDDARRLRTSGSLLFYVGRIEYGDLFTTETHVTEFCFRYFGDGKSGGWHACEWRNSIL